MFVHQWNQKGLSYFGLKIFFLLKLKCNYIIPLRFSLSRFFHTLLALFQTLGHFSFIVITLIREYKGLFLNIYKLLSLCATCMNVFRADHLLLGKQLIFSSLNYFSHSQHPFACSFLCRVDASWSFLIHFD